MTDLWSDPADRARVTGASLGQRLRLGAMFLMALALPLGILAVDQYQSQQSVDTGGSAQQIAAIDSAPSTFRSASPAVGDQVVSTTSTAPPTTVPTTVPTTAKPTTTPKPTTTVAGPPPGSGSVAPPTEAELRWLACTRRRESGGNYQIVSSGGTYMGAYQFLQTTWNSAARIAGRPDLVGQKPNTVAPEDQDLVALAYFRKAGAGPWGGRCV